MNQIPLTSRLPLCPNPLHRPVLAFHFQVGQVVEVGIAFGALAAGENFGGAREAVEPGPERGLPRPH